MPFVVVEPPCDAETAHQHSDGVVTHAVRWVARRHHHLTWHAYPALDAHVRQLVLFATFWYVPLGHGVHGTLPPTPKLPWTQFVPRSDTAPLKHPLPAGAEQLVHPAAPASEY